MIEALGQGVPDALPEALVGVAFTKDGWIATLDGSSATSLAGVFAAGNLVNGSATAVQGIAEGMHAGGEIHAYLV